MGAAGFAKWKNHQTKLENILRKFYSPWILRAEIKGFPKVKHFLVDFEKISSLLPQIYQFVGINKLHVETCKLIVDFYRLDAETYKQKNIKERINNKK